MVTITNTPTVMIKIMAMKNDDAKAMMSMRMTVLKIDRKCGSRKFTIGPSTKQTD